MSACDAKSINYNQALFKFIKGMTTKTIHPFIRILILWINILVETVFIKTQRLENVVSENYILTFKKYQLIQSLKVVPKISWRFLGLRRKIVI